MNSVIDALNGGFGWLVSILLIPFSTIPRVWGLIAISVISGVVLLLFYGRISNQEGLRRVKAKIYSFLLESVLYRHDLTVSLKAQGRMFTHAFIYFRYALLPILVLMIPCIVLLAQLNERYNYEGLQVGERALLSVSVTEGQQPEGISLQVSEGLKVTPRLVIADQNKVEWGLESVGEGKQEVVVKSSAGEVKTKRIFVGDDNRFVSTGSFSSWLWALLYPGDKMLASESVFSEITVKYPEKRYRIFGMNMHWVIVFLLVSIIAGLFGSKVFGVEI